MAHGGMNPPLPVVVLLDGLLVALWLGMIYSLAKEPSMELKIESNTRQWLGIVIIGGIIAAMIFAGLIPAPEYEKYVDFVLGAFFYHVVRMLNAPDQLPDATKLMDPTKEN